MRRYSLLCFKRCICLSTVVFLRHLFWGQLEEAFWTSGRWMKWTTRARRGCIPPRFAKLNRFLHIASLSQGSNVWSANGGRCHDSSQGLWGKPCLVPQALFFTNPLVLPASARPGILQGKALSDVFFSFRNSSVTHASDKENLNNYTK